MTNQWRLCTPLMQSRFHVTKSFSTLSVTSTLIDPLAEIKKIVRGQNLEIYLLIL